jgi:hypothetical protein
VDGCVDLAVAGAIEAVTVGSSRAGGDRGDPRGSRELGVSGEAIGAGDLTDELGRGQRPAAALGDELRRDLGDEVGDLCLERSDGVGQLARRVSGFLWVRPGPWLGQSVSEVDFERDERGVPVVGLSPGLLGVDDREVDELAGGVFGGEVAAGLDRLSDLAVQRLDAVGNRYERRQMPPGPSDCLGAGGRPGR